MESLRAFVEGPSRPVVGREWALSRDESRHLAGARRVRVGERISLLDGQGCEWVVEVQRADPKATLVFVLAEVAHPLPLVQLHLAQVLPKGKTMDAVVHRATELGVQMLVPLLGDHAEVHLDERRQLSKAGRWDDIAIEALKQSGNPWRLQVQPVQSVQEFLARNDLPPGRVVAALRPEARPLLTVARDLGAAAREVVLLVGPEGDLSPREYEAAFARGFRPVSLGSRVLRVETAVVALLALWQAAAEGLVSDS